MSSLVEMYIRGSKFVFWKDVRITRNIDSVDEVSFSAPFEHDAPGFKENFRPFAFNPVLISVDGSPLFTGTMVDPRPNVTDTERTVVVRCYAKCGVLMDCTMPPGSMPLEYNNLNLKEIAQTMAGPFGIMVDFIGDPGPKFGRVACEPDAKVFEFLTDLAKQRGYVMSNNESGDLVFWKSVSDRPVAVLTQGESPLKTITPEFNPQEFYSDLTGLTPVEVGRPAAKKTVKTKKDPKAPKPKVPAAPKPKAPKPAKKYTKFSATTEAEVYRPLVFKINDVDGVDTETATKAALARMLGNMATYSITVSTWRDSNGALWRPNTKIKVSAPDAMIYDYYEFEVKSVEFSQDEGEEVAAIMLALPGSFSGEPPEVFPWEL